MQVIFDSTPRADSEVVGACNQAMDAYEAAKIGVDCLAA
jgi:hypothetical protein